MSKADPGRFEPAMVIRDEGVLSPWAPWSTTDLYYSITELLAITKFLRLYISAKEA